MAFFNSRVGGTTVGNGGSCNLALDMEVPQPPSDSISAIAWSPTADYLAVSSWDNQVRIYEVGQTANAIQGKAAYSHEGPALDVCWSKDGTKVFSGGIDNAARMFDTQTGQPTQVAQHEAPVKSVRFTDMHGGLLVTGSWDKTIKYWDLRSPNPIGTIQLPERCYTMDIQQQLMVVGMAERQIMLVDLRNPTTIGSVIESPLKFQTRCISVSPDASLYAVGGIEGRTAIQFITPTKTNDNYSFRCHRAPEKDQKVKDGSVAHIYALNDLAFHPVHGTCVTAGSDGCFSSWDLHNKRLLKNHDIKTVNNQNLKAMPIVAAAYNNTNSGNRFAYAVSYDWAHGHKGAVAGHPNKIMIHTVKDEEIKKKPK